MYVVWRTEGPIKPVVKYGKSLSRLTSEVSYLTDAAGTSIVTRVSLGTNTQSIPSRWQRYRTEENLKLEKLHSAPVGTFQYDV